MDFESPDVEKDFPGLYASETGRKSNESDFSDGGDHEKPSKKDLLGRRKDKKDSKKDRGYAALEGESSPEEDTDTKSPSKSKKTKSFKFPTKSKEKREKSRDKEKVLEDVSKQKELNEKEKKKEKEREKGKKEKEKKDKLREKDKEKEEKAKFKLESKEKLKDDKKEKVKETKEKVKDKEKEKVREKDKEKKEKKLTKMPSAVTSGVPFEEIFTLGVALPIFGVPLQQSVERSRCHDDSALPLLVRDTIDFLQANGLKSGELYRTEADKIKLQQLKKLYMDRGVTFPYHWDVPVACAMLKMFLSELPESILSQELHGQFEQASAISEPQREVTMVNLLNRLPSCNLSLLGWLIRHFQSVLAHEQTNHVNIQTLCTYMCPSLGVSQNLLAYLISKADKLFPDVRLTKYVPPLLSLPADFPDSASEICSELRKQESLLSQIHSEMHAGFISPARDQQLWEAQTILTQLKRKLRLVQKSVEPTSLPPQQQSIEEKQEETYPPNEQTEEQVKIEEGSSSSNEPTGRPQESTAPEEEQSQDPTFPVDFDSQSAEFPVEFEDNFEFKENENESEVEKPKLTEKELKVLRLQLENAEYLQLKSLLQAKINSEQFEIVKLRSHVALKNKQEGQKEKEIGQEDTELKQRLLKENAILEQKRLTLVNQIFQERVACVQLKIELAMKEIMSKS